MSLLNYDHVAFFHAHPDDETLATGGLIAHLVASGKRVSVLTATRGERGEVYPDVAYDSLPKLRESELACALGTLGVDGPVFLGSAPAVAEPRRYEDSGMIWLSPGLAGPDPMAPRDCFANAQTALADLRAWCVYARPDLLLTYGAAGGYGHPDHIRCHELANGADDLVAVGNFYGPQDPVPGDAFTIDHSKFAHAVRSAHACYSSQFRLEGEQIVHVGGQRAKIAFETRVAIPKRPEAS